MTWESIRADVRLAIRQCRRAPLFAVLTVASLALGIGANSAMFGVVKPSCSSRCPTRTLARWSRSGATTPRPARRTTPCRRRNYEAFKAAPSLAATSRAMYSFVTPVQIASTPNPSRSSSRRSHRACSRCSAARRSWVASSMIPARRQGAMLSYQYWQRRFGGDPRVIGRTLALSGAGPAEPIPSSASCRRTSRSRMARCSARQDSRAAVTVDMWWPMSRQRDPRLVDESGQPNRGIHYFGVVGRLAARRLDRTGPRRPAGDRRAARAGLSRHQRRLGRDRLVRCTSRRSAPCGRRCCCCSAASRRAADHLHQRRERPARARRQGAAAISRSARHSAPRASVSFSRHSPRAFCCRSPVASSDSA